MIIYVVNISVKDLDVFGERKIVLSFKWPVIPGGVIPNTRKMVVEASLLNTQHYKVWIKDKEDQYKELSSALPYTSV